jgi:hypothetical protein
MTRFKFTLAVAVALVLTSLAWAADPPTIKGITPFGVPRGQATEVTISGGNLTGNTQFLAPFPFAIDPDSTNSSDAGKWIAKITVAPDVPLGVYPIRVKTDGGLSNPFLFSVGQLPQVTEKEDNNTFETAQVIPALCVVEGQVAGNDVDFFKFVGRKGQSIVVDAQCVRIGSTVDPSIRLTTAARAYVASSDDAPGLVTDARLSTILPEDGEYVIELSDSRYQGGSQPIYRLLVGSVPVADEIFPLGGRQGETVGFELRGGTIPGMRVAAATLAPDPGEEARIKLTNQTLGIAGPNDPVLDLEAVPPLVAGTLPEVREPADPAAPLLRVALPVVLNGRIDPAGDEDRYVFSVTPGQKIRMRMLAADLNSALDGQLQVVGAKGTIVATADDTNLPALIIPKKANQKADPIISPDPSLDYTVPAGLTEVTIAVRDLEGRGGVGYAYRITVEPVVPSFDLRITDSQLNIPKGGTVAIAVTATRQGYNGPITLDVAKLPPGLTVRKGVIAAGQTAGTMTLTAAPDAAFDLADLRIMGTGEGPDGPIVCLAKKPQIFAQQGTLPTNVVWQIGLPVAPVSAGAVELETPAEPIEIVHGFEAKIPIKLTRSKDADAEVDIATLPPLPPGLTASASKIAEKTNEGSATIKAGPDAALGLLAVVLTGKGKFADKTQTFIAPLVTLNVVRPASVELGSASVDVKAGESFELKGKLVRKGPFKEPVTLKLNGLPAGLKAEPVTVAPDATEFAIKVTSEPSAEAATATIQVAIAFQLDKKDYSTPPVSFALKVLPAK